MVNQAAARAAEEVLRRGDVEPNRDVLHDFHGHPLSLDDVNRGSVGCRRRHVNRTMTDKPEITEIVNMQMPLGATLGIRTYGDADEVDSTVEWAPELCTAAGVLHGGVLMALADSAGGVCAFLNLPPGASTVTIESKTNFLGAIREGLVTARARPLHVGSRTIVIETDLLDASGRRVGRTTQTQAVLAAE